MGSVDVVESTEIGGDRVTIFRQEATRSRLATIVLRGATQSQLDDMERAIDDGVSVVKALTKDARLVPGAGAAEIELAERVGVLGSRTPGLLQHAIRKFGEALEVVPRTLAESAGLDAGEIIARLYAAHKVEDKAETKAETKAEDKGEDKGEEKPEGKAETESGISIGVDIDGGIFNVTEKGILDLLAAKQWALKLATDAATTVLSVDMIIIARPAGGPKPPQKQGHWDED
jgi:T-complex protein 1 subunit theta